MKKIIIIILVSFCYSSFAQKFEVTPDGLKDSSKLENSYLVFDVEDKTAKELYDKAVEYIIKSYKNPDEVMKGEIEGEYLRFDTYVSKLLYIKNMGIKQFFSATYSTELKFKDGKVRYEIVELEMNHVENDTELYFTAKGLNWYIYNKNKILKRPESKSDIENYFNATANLIFEFINGQDEEEW